MKHRSFRVAGLLVPILAGTMLLAAPGQEGRSPVPGAKLKPAPSAAKVGKGFAAPKAGTSAASSATIPTPNPSGDSSSNLLTYLPPRRGMPAIRDNAGSRGSGGQYPSLSVLAPIESGWTISEQPSLYFYLSRKPETPVVFALAIPDQTEPLLKTNLAERIQPGFNRIRLADHGVTLSPGVEYRWSVTVVISPESPSQNIFQEGGIERIDPEPRLVQRMSEARVFDRPRVCLDGRLWYDAIDALMRLRDLDSSNALLREQLASLLALVGLTDVKL